MDRSAAYVADMAEAVRELIGLTQGMSLDQFTNDRIRCLAAEKLFINLGEAARRVAPDRAAAITGVPWSRVIGLRNILAHGYEQIEHEVLFKTIVEDLPPVMTALQDWLEHQSPAA